jgi:hypothetical protein
MEKDELVAVLAESNEALVKAVAEAVSKSVAPAEGEGAAEETAPVAEAPAEEAVAPSITAEAVGEAVAKAIEEHVIKQYNPILEALVERFEKIESHLGFEARKSLDGQESAEDNKTEAVTKATPDLSDAISAAFNKR